MMGVRTQLSDHEKPEQVFKKMTPTQLAALTGAWDKLEERKRVIRMKPAPRAIDVTPKPKPVARPIPQE